MAEAAAIPEAFATAYLNLFMEGSIQPGNTLLMHAGASGLASVSIPMAKAFGVRVITTVLSDEIAVSIAHHRQREANHLQNSAHHAGRGGARHPLPGRKYRQGGSEGIKAEGGGPWIHSPSFAWR